MRAIHSSWSAIREVCRGPIREFLGENSGRGGGRECCRTDDRVLAVATGLDRRWRRVSVFALGELSDQLGKGAARFGKVRVGVGGPKGFDCTSFMAGPYGIDHLLRQGSATAEAKNRALRAPRAPIQRPREGPPPFVVERATEASNEIEIQKVAMSTFGWHVDFARDVLGIHQHRLCRASDRARPMVEVEVSSRLFHGAHTLALEKVLAHPAFARDRALKEMLVGHRVDRPNDGATRQDLSVQRRASFSGTC